MNQVILSSDQFVLLTLLLKLAVMASLATLLVNFSSFKRLLFTDPRGRARDVRVALLLALFFSFGAAIRILMGYWATDLSLPGSFLIGLLTGMWPGAIAGAVISLPAFVHGEFLSLPIFIACGLAGGALRASLADRSSIWSFSPLPFASLYRSTRASIAEKKVEGQLIILFTCLGLDAIHYIVSHNYSKLLFDLHPDHGLQLAYATEGMNRETAGMIHQHHERLDGTGYPIGLVADDLSQASRICAVVDVYDAMSNPRPYRDPLSTEYIMQYLIEQAPNRLDGGAVETWVEIVRQVANPGAGSMTAGVGSDSLEGIL